MKINVDIRELLLMIIISGGGMSAYNLTKVTPDWGSFFDVMFGQFLTVLIIIVSKISFTIEDENV